MQFIKTYGNKLDVSSSEENLLGQGADKRQTTRHLITFSTFYSGRTLSGVFLTGEKPLWFLKGDVTSLLCLPCEFAVVHAFTACSIWDGQSSFLMNTDEVRIFQNKKQISRKLSFCLIGRVHAWSPGSQT